MKFSRIFIALIFFLTVSGLAQETAPNIVLIISDQHSGLVLNQRGYPNLATPGIDKIAEQGVMFSRSYCTYPVCTSSRKSFMTGLMPSQLDDLRDHTAIGQALQDGGYETAYFGKWHVGSTDIDEMNDWHRFQTYIDGRNDSNIAEWSRNFIKQDHDKPFFMITSLLNPHDCCELARNISGDNDNYHDGPIEESMDTAYCPPLPENFAIPINEAEGFYGRMDQNPGEKYWNAHPTKNWTEVEWRQYLYGYDRLVEKVDDHILSIYDQLDNLGLLENTVIIYTSDHGDGIAAHRWNQKKSFYEESVNIPFLVSWKGQSKTGVIDETTLVSNGLDLYPTILSLAEMKIPETLIGIDLKSKFMLNPGENETTAREYVVSEINQKVYKGHTPGTFTGKMLVTDSLKYILFNKGVNREQLFDLNNDPGELNPVTDDPDYIDELSYCRKKLKEWTEINGDGFNVDDIINEYDSEFLLDDLFVNDSHLADFTPLLYNYSLDLDSVNEVYVNAIPVNSGAKIYIDLPSDISGDSATQTAQLLVISKNGSRGAKYFIKIEGNIIKTFNEPEYFNQVQVYPNPTSNVLNIDFESLTFSGLKIYNSLGQVVFSNADVADDLQLDISHLKSGIYHLVLESSYKDKSILFLKSDQ